MKSSNKMKYVPPTLEVRRVVLEAVIAVSSPVQKVNLKNWEYETADDPDNNADIILIF